MNNIYKVIWSKAKNCYVVASEIARSHTKSASGSEKIGGVTRRSLLASLMALSLLCGGLGVTSAVDGTVHVDESSTPSTATEVYTTAKVDTLLDKKADKTAVEEIKNTVGDVDSGLVKKTNDNATAIEVNRTNINTLKDTVGDDTKGLTKKINDNTAAIAMKADTAAVTTLEGRVGDVEGKVTTLKTTVGDASSGLVKDVATLKTTVGDASSGLVKDVTALETTVGDASSGLVKDVNDLRNQGNTLNTALGSKADQSDLDAANEKINALQKKTTNISYADGAGTSIDGITVKDGNIVGNGNSAITGITNIATDNINGKSLAGTTVATVKEVTDAVESEKTERENADKALSDRIGNLTEDKNYIKKAKNVSDNLVELDTRAKTNADNIKSNKDEIARVNGELVKTNDYFNTELSKTNNHFNTELGKTNAALQATNKRTAGIERTDTEVAADNQTVIEGNVRFDQNGNVSGVKDLKTDTIHANGEIKTSGTVSAGNVSTGTLETTGDATIGRDLTVKGTLNTKDVTAETIHVSKSEDTPDYTSKGSIIGEGGHLSVSNEKTDKRTNITEKSELNVNEKGTVNWATSTDNTTGNVTEGRSEVTADNIKNSVKKTEGGKTFGYEENITADGKVGTVTDEEGNTSSTRQDSKGIYGYAKDKDGNKSYTKQEGNRIAESVIGQDGKQTKSEMNSTGITNTAKDGTITNTAKNVTNEGTESVTNKVGNNEVKVSQDGVDIKAEDGKKITESVGTASRVVENDKITDNAGDSTVTTEKDKGTTFGKTESTGTTNIYGDSIKTGTINARDTTTDKLTAGAAAGADGGRLTVDASDGVKGSYESGKYTSKSYILANTLKSGVDNDKDPTDTDFVGSRTDHYMDGDKAKLDETVKDADGSNVTNKTSTGTATTITDGNGKTSATIQDVKNLAGSVTNGTETGVSGIHANDDGSVSIDSAVSGEGGSSVINQKKDSITSAVGNADGSISTVIRQDKDNVTIASSNGTVGIGGKDIVNNAQNTIINTAGTKITDTAGDSTVTTENGKGTTFTKTGSTAYREGGPTDTNISGNTITTGKVTMDYAEVMKDLGVTGKTTTGSLEVKGESKLTGKVTMESDATVGGKLDVTGKATFSDDVDIKKNLSVDGNATINGDVTAKSYKVGDKTYIDKNGIHANGQKITDVADGSISEGSKDAVNGGQLYTVKNDLEGKVNKVGANAAAMANLHPMEFDPDSKWNIAAAIGNYGSETAAALGAFYRPNDDVMVNLSTAFGTGENMVGGGVSVRLGKGGNKLSREENNALKAQVADLTARMDALLSVLNPNMSKDFPDVPENHWAYEAVSRLAGNDIVQGYPDGEFHGERTMTRYEMAEIIYNALSRGAEAERELVEEFKPELQAMAASEKATAEKAEG